MSDAPHIWVARFKPREKVVTLPDGRRARRHLDASGTVLHTETDHQLDALVRPLRTTTVKVGHLREPILEWMRREGRLLDR